MEIRHYLTIEGVDPFQVWLDSIGATATRVVTLRRLDRIAKANFGDRKFCGEGVWELRIDYGPGYRVYYGQAGKWVVLLLCGGTKRTQTKDIEKAIEFWADFRQRHHDP